ncbi:ERCC4-like protein [Leptotrombidium deliense]|uniref:Crossover junction endonuclease MUS81 n=1 Tax=Leptotrombidium deliense TaxID=299467 RepID=A0A443SL89_9ACAR|nr:ERCC4-like protein [Leptotrombidium deliense]
MESNKSSNNEFRDKVLKFLNKNREANKGSKMEFVFGKSLKSLKESTNPISTVEDLLAIKHFGPKLCQKIAQDLQYDFSGTLDIDTRSSQQSNSSAGVKQKRNSKAVNPSGSTGESPLRKKRTYCPKPNSGGYAILRALFEAQREGHSSLAKNELLLKAQKYSHESMTKAKSGSYYTAWSSMTTLIKHGLVEAERHRFATYSLTDEGTNIVQRIRNYETHTLPSIDEAVDSNLLSAESNSANQIDNAHNSQSSTERVIMFPNTFDIIFIIDSREQHSGVPNAYKKTALLSQLQKEGVVCEMKALAVGDFAWIARLKSNSLSRYVGTDLILDFVIERKRIDDLAKSIIDDRWKEQKFRLKQSGVRKPIYLIEEFNSNSRKFCSVPFERMETAVVNSEVYDQVEFVYTKNHGTTLSYLVTMTKALNRMYSSKTLYSCTKEEIANNCVSENHFMTFCEFERVSTKITNFTVGEMFVKHLLQFRGISVSKAKTITEHYPTLSRLLDAYEICESDNERKELLSSIVCGERKIGSVVSNRLFHGLQTIVENYSQLSVKCD